MSEITTMWHVSSMGGSLELEEYQVFPIGKKYCLVHPDFMYSDLIKQDTLGVQLFPSPADAWRDYMQQCEDNISRYQIWKQRELENIERAKAELAKLEGDDA